MTVSSNGQRTFRYWVARYVSDDEDDFVVHEDELEETGIHHKAVKEK